jgi:leucyl-tRNA synthetase
MFDAGLVKFQEPFPVLRNQGMIWAGDGQKMSKSKGNVVTPDAMVEKYGADALRLWELFMGPFEQATNWNETGIVSTARYLSRAWGVIRRYVDAGCPEGNPNAETLKRAHKTIRTVTDHIERMRYNTAFSALMDQLNYIQKLTPEEMGRFSAESYVVMLAIMAPHITEEMWRALGHNASIHLEPWPGYDTELTRDELITVVVQVNGKVRDRLLVPAGATEEANTALALNSEAVVKHLGGKAPRKVIYVPDKLVSIVA